MNFTERTIINTISCIAGTWTRKQWISLDCTQWVQSTGGTRKMEVGVMRCALDFPNTRKYDKKF